MDLTDKIKSNDPAKSILKISSTDVEEKLKKKISQVSIKEKEVEAMRLAAQLGYPHIDLEKFPVSQQALKQVDRAEAERLQAVCFYFTTDEIRIGAVNPEDPQVQELFERVKEANSAGGLVYVISKNSLERVLKMYDRLPTVAPISKDLSIKEEEMKQVQADINDFHQLQDLLNKTSTTDLLTFLLGAGLKLEASDLHIEAEEKTVVVRMRLDGILHDAAELERAKFNKLLARIKINIINTPQDGRFTIKLSTGDVDVRISTMPTVFGESVVMRLLPQQGKKLTLDKIGLYGDAYERLKREIDRPNGMIVTTGPTGSGKTTTLYSMMNILNKPGVKIITLEDPVEYRMEGINQSQVDSGKGYTFASGLRSILRQDPDIAMVGEIRDLETAEISIQAALTGHLILTTLHTNNAAAAIPRLLSMGVKGFLLAPALNSIIGQRLVRRVCAECKEEEKLSPEVMDRINKTIESMPEKKRAEIKDKKLIFYKGKGCQACHSIGYKGRIGIYEVLLVSHGIEKLILEGKVSEYEIEKQAIVEGMTTMVQDGILKALTGETSVEEVFRVIE